MSELRIDRLRVRIDHGAGHEHRLATVARQAAAILAARLAERLATAPAGVRSAPSCVSATPVRLSLSATTDAAAARRIASAWLDAVTPRRGATTIGRRPMRRA